MDKITIGIASIKSREKSLEKTIESLLNQTVKPDRIFVHLNDYDNIPKFLQKKEKVGFAINTGDRGDAGKFSLVDFDECKGYFLTCDDDLWYPPDYVENLIASIDKRKKIISYHGSILKFPVRNYYRNRKIVHFKHEVKVPTPVHIGGTGVMGFHTNTFKLSLDDFKLPNMSDIWVALQAQKQGIGIVVPPHPENWIKILPDTVENSLFQKFSRSQGKIKIVADAINSIDKWILY